jgi:hypothetical protein
VPSRDTPHTPVLLIILVRRLWLPRLIETLAALNDATEKLLTVAR